MLDKGSIAHLFFSPGGAVGCVCRAGYIVRTHLLPPGTSCAFFTDAASRLFLNFFFVEFRCVHYFQDSTHLSLLWDWVGVECWELFIFAGIR